MKITCNPMTLKEININIVVYFLPGLYPVHASNMCLSSCYIFLHKAKWCQECKQKRKGNYFSCLFARLFLNECSFKHDITTYLYLLLQRQSQETMLGR